MSKKRTVIELEPEGRIHKEAFMTAPMVCPYCNGRGFFMEPLLPGVDVKKDCPDCEGTGEVVALVTIDWKPNKE